MRIVAAFTGLCLILGMGAARAESPETRLLQIADADHVSRDEALVWWNGLTDAARVDTLRTALSSKNKHVAQVAAASIGYPYLDANEIRFTQQLLRDRPAWSLGKKPQALAPLALIGKPGFGSGDVVPYWKHAVKVKSHDDPNVLQTAHRCLKLEHVTSLAPLLERASPEAFTQLLWSIQVMSQVDRDDRYRETFARAFTYGLKRLQAERAGKPRPKYEATSNVSKGVEGEGIPRAYATLLEACKPGVRDGFTLWNEKERRWVVDDQAPLSAPMPIWWLVRWTHDLRPTPKDIPTLEGIIDRGARGEAGDYVVGKPQMQWAMRALAGMEGHADRLRSWASKDDSRGVCAVGILAELGDLVAIKQVRALPSKWPSTLWLLDRHAARELEVKRIAAQKNDELTDRDRLDAEQRRESYRAGANAVRAKDIAAIAQRLWQLEIDPLKLLWFHSQVWPGSMTRAQAKILCTRLTAMKAHDWEYQSLELFEPALLEIERLAPKELRALFASWLKSQPGAHDEVLDWLMRLGVAGHEEAMHKFWPSMDVEWQWHLGLVPGERVRAFLRARVDGGDPTRAGAALQALLLHYGVPVEVMPLLIDSDLVRGDVSPETSLLKSTLALLDLGDLAGALLEVAKHMNDDVRLLSHVDDPRVREFLRTAQQERHRGLYWQATSALARLGDKDALAECTMVLQDGRTWVSEGLHGGFAFRDPQVVSLLLDQLDSNCCLGWAAHVHLKELYPQLPFDDGWGGAGTSATRAWIEQFEWVKSSIDGRGMPIRK